MKPALASWLNQFQPVGGWVLALNHWCPLRIHSKRRSLCERVASS